MIEKEPKRLRFSLDQRMISKYSMSFDDAGYGERATREKEIVWREAVELIAEGIDVVLDWSFWSAEQRMQWAERVRSVGAEPVLIYLDIDFAENVDRLHKRNANVAEDTTHFIPIQELERFRPYFEVPSEEEGLVIEYVK